MDQNGDKQIDLQEFKESLQLRSFTILEPHRYREDYVVYWEVAVMLGLCRVWSNVGLIYQRDTGSQSPCMEWLVVQLKLLSSFCNIREPRRSSISLYRVSPYHLYNASPTADLASAKRLTC